jgi:hypothetical protein
MALNLFMLPQQVEMQAALPDNSEERTLLALLSYDPLHIDEIIRESGLPTTRVSSTLMMMELTGNDKTVWGDAVCVSEMNRGGTCFLLSRLPFEGESYDGKGHVVVSPIFFFEAVSDPLYSFRSSIPYIWMVPAYCVRIRANNSSIERGNIASGSTKGEPTCIMSSVRAVLFITVEGRRKASMSLGRIHRKRWMFVLPPLRCIVSSPI